MDKIEEVKGILEECVDDYYKKSHPIDVIAFQICQLFEPKPELDALPQYARDAGYGTASRLLTDEEITKAWKSAKPNETEFLAVAKAQDAKTASIKDAEIKQLKENHQIELQMLAEDLRDKMEARVERIKKAIEAHLYTDCTSEYPGHRNIYYKWWQEFWKQEGL